MKNYLAVFPGLSVRFLMTLIISGWPHVFTEASQAAAHRSFWQRMADCLGCAATEWEFQAEIRLDWIASSDFAAWHNMALALTLRECGFNSCQGA